MQGGEQGPQLKWETKVEQTGTLPKSVYKSYGDFDGGQFMVFQGVVGEASKKGGGGNEEYQLNK